MALAISNSCHVIHGETWQQREEVYKATMNKYDKSERSKLAEMSGMLVMALEENMGDTLSEPCIVDYPAERVFYTPAKMGLSL